jgi:hypothetical protein
MLMLMLHAAVFANRQTLAGRLQFLQTLVFLFARFQAFSGALVGGGDGAVALDVRLGFLVTMFLLRY